MMSDRALRLSDTCNLDSPRTCFHCGQPLTLTAATVDSTDPSVSDTDYDRAEETLSAPPRVVVSDPSLISSRSSTPHNGFVPPPLASSDDECTSLLSSDGGGYYASSDDMDSEYVSAMEVPPEAQSNGGNMTTGRDSTNMFNELDDPNASGSTYDCANEELEAISSLDDDDDENDDDDDDAAPANSTMMGSDALQESSNSASTLLEDRDDAPQDSGHGAQSSSEEDSDVDDDDRGYGEEMELLGELSDDADGDGEDSCLTPGNNPTEPLLASAVDSDKSDLSDGN